MALQFLEYGGFGTRSCPDMLSITYYAGNYRGTMSKEYTREIQDTYYQLDQDTRSYWIRSTRKWAGQYIGVSSPVPVIIKARSLIRTA